MSSTYGERFRMTIFGQSHAPAIGVTMEGLPAGIEVDEAKLQAFLERRAPGRSLTATSRKEPDQVEFLAGLVGGRTCGAPLTAIIRNTNTRSKDYDNLRDCPRPGHADYPAQVKFGGYQDVAGGGHFSGRLTAPLCIAGGIALQVLSKLGITVAAHIQSIGQVDDDRFDLAGVNEQQLQALLKKPFPVLRDGAAQEMEQAILAAKSKLDSLGGVIECAAVGVPAGWGDPMFGGMENRIAQMVFGIPAIRGIEFGLGFPAARLTGSEHNDPYYMDGIQVKTRTNRHGGILGGITSGMPIVFRAAVKPTSSIAQRQESVSLAEKTDVPLEIHGRHDPCITTRAVPVVEAAMAIALLDAYFCASTNTTKDSPWL